MKKFWIGLAVGALVGGVAVLFLAPQSGASTRRKVRRSFEDLGDSLNDAADYVKQQAERLGKEAQNLIDGSKGQIGGVMNAAQNYANSADRTASGKATRIM